MNLKIVNKSILVVLSAIFIAGMTGCTGNFEDYNKMPYRPGEEDLNADNVSLGILFPSMINLIQSIQQNQSQMIDQMIGGEYGGYFSSVNSWNGTNFYTYNPSDDWINSMFNALLTHFYSSWYNIREKTEGKGPVYAWAQIARAGVMLKLTDTYGPIPYSKMGGGTFHTEYDSQKDVYAAILDDLDDAIAVIKSYVDNGGDAKLMAEYDISSFEGDFNMWLKYANSLRLRMAVRIRNVEPDWAKQVAESAVNSSVGLIEQSGDLMTFSTIQQNPLFIAGTTWGDLRANASITSVMNGYNDPRVSKYFTSTLYSPRQMGVRTGINQVVKSDYAGFSAPNFAMYDATIVMSPAEIAFLKAEGALAQWDMGNSAQSFYMEGIRLSFEQWGCSGVDDYISDATSSPMNYVDPLGRHSMNALISVPVKYNDSDSEQVCLEKIITQKWIAIYPLGFEAWCDYRRTGYPRLFPVVNNLSGGTVVTARGMRRLPFPPAEYNNNRDNVIAAVALLGGVDTGATDLWWANKN